MEKFKVQVDVFVDGDLCGWDRECCFFLRKEESSEIYFCDLYGYDLKTKFFSSFLGKKVLRCKKCLDREGEIR